MNCYYHQSQQAIGICKNCQKGICADCAIDVGNGLACKNSCEAQVLEINRFFEQGKMQFRLLESNIKLSTKWIGVLGIAFVLFAIVGSFIYPDLPLSNLMLFIIGLAFLFYTYKNRKSEKRELS